MKTLSSCHNVAMSAPKKRLKAAESRRALLDAGFELLKSRGVAPGLDRVTLKEAIEISGVPRSTAYRLYEGGRGQLEEFRADQLSDLDVIDMQPSFDVVTEVLSEVRPLIDSQDPVKMAEGLRELIRCATNRNLESLLTSLPWRVYMSSLAAVDTGPGGDRAMNETFRVAAEQFGKSYVGVFEHIAGLVGLRPRQPLTYGEFGVALAAIAEGVGLRVPTDSRLASLKRPTGPNGELQTWNATGCAAEALMLTWLEPDPAFVVSADLSAWTSFG